jgi:hypothetical protein
MAFCPKTCPSLKSGFLKSNLTNPWDLKRPHIGPFFSLKLQVPVCDKFLQKLLNVKSGLLIWDKSQNWQNPWEPKRPLIRLFFSNFKLHEPWKHKRQAFKAFALSTLTYQKHIQTCGKFAILNKEWPINLGWFGIIS